MSRRFQHSGESCCEAIFTGAERRSADMVHSQIRLNNVQVLAKYVDDDRHDICIGLDDVLRYHVLVFRLLSGRNPEKHSGAT